MIQQEQCKGDDDYEDNDYVEERCQLCGKRMTNVKYIYTNLDDGNYYCKKCVNTYDINSVLCAEMNY